MASANTGSSHDLKVIIIGKAGSGKSTLGNIIIGKDCFGTQPGMSIKTKEHKCESASLGLERFRSIRVVDTPDIEVFRNNGRELKEAIDMWKASVDFKPDAILYTIRCDEKYEPASHEKYKIIKDLWGPEFCENLIVAFTFGDKKYREIAKDIRLAGPDLRAVLADASERYAVFASMDPRMEQVEELLTMISSMKPLASGTTEPSSFGRQSSIRQSQANEKRKHSFLIIGRSKTGKSDVASFLAGKSFSPYSPTAQKQTRQTGNADITVIEAPDPSTSTWRESTVKREVSTWKEMTGEKPDFILFTVQCDKRFGTDDLQYYKMIKSIWGKDDFTTRVVIVFTHGEKKERDIKKHLHVLGGDFNEVFADANRRYVYFEKETAKDLMQFIEQMLQHVDSLSSGDYTGDVAMVDLGSAVPSSFGHSTLGQDFGQRPGIYSHHYPYATALSSVPQQQKRLSMLVIGKAGTGKSSLCNAILHQKKFEVAVGMEITTKTAAKGSAVLGALYVEVVDTPDITNLPVGRDRSDEISNWQNLTYHEPDVVVLTIRCDSKYTPEDFALYRDIKNLWPSLSLQRKLVVAFTFGDKKVPDFDVDVQRAGSNLQAVMRAASQRHVIYNDRSTQREKLIVVQSLLDIC